MGADTPTTIAFAVPTWPTTRVTAYILGSMAEVPEYLLERSRARRAALGLSTGGPPPASTGTDAAASDAGGATPILAAASAAPVLAAAAPAGLARSEPAPSPLDNLPAYAREPGRRTGIPAWMMPILLLLPLWAIVYMGSFGEASSASASGPNGAEIFQKCAVCHGAKGGGGGTGPKLAGEVTLTFPTEADHIAFVKAGSGPIKGQPYGDPNRPGGQHIAKSGGMPAWATQLSEEEIAAVVKFEREGL